MSVDYEAVAVIGLKINKEAMYRQIKVRASYASCACSREPDPDAVFCSNCGKSLWTTKNEFTDNFAEDDSRIWFIGKTRKFFVVQSYNYDGDPTYFIALFYADSDNECNKANLPMAGLTGLPYMKEQMEKELGDLWNEDNFGLWADLSTS